MSTQANAHDADTAQLALAVSGCAKLLSIRMIDFSARWPVAHDSDDLPHEVHLDTDAKASILDNGELRVTVGMKLSIIVSQDEVTDSPVTAQGDFELIYALESPSQLKQTHYDAFARTNAIFNVWPYWREFVQSATVRLGLPALTLPLFRLQPVLAKTKQKRPNRKSTKK